MTKIAWVVLWGWGSLALAGIPQALIERAPNGAVALAIGKDDVYLLSRTTLIRASKHDGNQQVLHTLSTGTFSSLAIDDKYLYWLHNGTADIPFGLYRKPLAGGPPEQLVEMANAINLRVKGEYAYYVTGTGIHRVSLTDGRETVLTSGEIAFRSFDVDDKWLYWSTFFSNDGQINKMPIEGGGVVPLVDNPRLPFRLILGGNYLFYAELTSKLWMSDLEGNNRRQLPGNVFPTGMVSDGKSVYFMTNNAYLARVRLDGDLYEVIDESPGSMVLTANMAMDENYVYYMKETNGLGNLYRIERD